VLEANFLRSVVVSQNVFKLANNETKSSNTQTEWLCGFVYQLRSAAVSLSFVG